MLRSKFVKFLISILNSQVNSSSNFASFFILMRHNSLVNFKLIHFLFWIKGPNKSPKFYTFECALVKICQILHVILESTKVQVSFPSHFASIFNAIKHNSSILFLAQTLYTLAESSSIKFKFLRFLNAHFKICQIPHINFEFLHVILVSTQISFLSNFASIFSRIKNNSSVFF